MKTLKNPLKFGLCSFKCLMRSYSNVKMWQKNHKMDLCERQWLGGQRVRGRGGEPEWDMEEAVTEMPWAASIAGVTNLSIQRVPGELLRASWARKVILTFWENDLWTFIFYFLNLENKNAHVWYWVRCVKLEGERKLPKGRVIHEPGTDILKYKRDRWKMKKNWEEKENTSQTYLFLVKVL